MECVRYLQFTPVLFRIRHRMHLPGYLHDIIRVISVTYSRSTLLQFPGQRGETAVYHPRIADLELAERLQASGAVVVEGRISILTCNICGC